MYIVINLFSKMGAINAINCIMVNFSEEITAHTQWAARFQGAIDGSGEEFDSLALARDDCCPLGEWIYGEGTVYYRLATYRIVRQDHEAFHRSAAQIAMLLHEKKMHEAHGQLLANAHFSLQTAAMVRSITALQKIVVEPHDHTTHVALPKA